MSMQKMGVEYSKRSGQSTGLNRRSTYHDVGSTYPYSLSQLWMPGYVYSGSLGKDNVEDEKDFYEYLFEEMIDK